MRSAVLALILAAVAAPALADPSPAQSPPEKTQSSDQQDRQAAEAQALSMRHKAEQDARIAAIACQAGDTSKCAPIGAQANNTIVPPKAPKP